MARPVCKQEVLVLLSYERASDSPASFNHSIRKRWSHSDVRVYAEFAADVGEPTDDEVQINPHQKIL